MSRNGDIALELGGEERTFRFGVAEHRRLQEALDCGVSEIVQDLHPYVSASQAGASIGDILTARVLGRIRVDHIREVLFQGLVGGGLKTDDASRLCRTWVLDRPILEAAPVAYAVGIAALVGVPDEEAASPGEPEGGQPPSPEEKSASAAKASTTSAPGRGSRRNKSTK